MDIHPMYHQLRLRDQGESICATGVRDTGEREVLAVDMGASEEEAFWVAFLRGLMARGLQGMELVISDAHQGLKEAIGEVLAGAAWQRCRVHFMRNVLAHVPKGDKAIVAAAIRTIFAQPNREAARQQSAEAAAALRLIGLMLSKSTTSGSPQTNP
ncbi:MAG: hypothetical protein GXP39_09700 [Chloroflexi bacterium]|nr:hypothetical protein [Chloroflexota bacterium]